MEPETVTISSICNGAVQETFGHLLSEVLKNIQDVNTDPEKARQITLKFEFQPFSDRTGALVAFSSKCGLVSIAPSAGTVFFAQADGQVRAYAHDTRQAPLFPSSEKPEKKVIELRK